MTLWSRAYNLCLIMQLAILLVRGFNRDLLAIASYRKPIGKLCVVVWLTPLYTPPGLPIHYLCTLETKGYTYTLADLAI